MIKLYNTLSRSPEELVPLEDNKIKLYTCGLTVYSHPHIGNWVAYIYWDILVRLLKHHGYNVTRVQNITDVGHLTSDEDSGEDKMVAAAQKERLSAWQVAEKYTEIAEHEAYELLKLCRPDHLIKATDYIDQQIEFVKQLEAKGFTYQIDGDGIYFDTAKLEDYGKLARLDSDNLKAGARVADVGKKNPTDFAVWKFTPANTKRDMEWDSPWGKGFPGWHLECSVMAREILGDQLDIHTGGIDHINIHHSNEIAQTEALTGKPFAKVWLHANHIKVDGQKMSKSLGNIYTLNDVIERGFDSEAFKLLVLGKHYRTEGNFSWENMTHAQNRLNNWRRGAEMRWQAAADVQPWLDKQNAGDTLSKALANDLSTPQAAAHIDQILAKALENGLANTEVDAFNDFLELINSLLGIDLASTAPDITDRQKEAISDRQSAKANGDFELADMLRGQLADDGLTLRDNRDQTYWSRQP